MKSKKKFQFKVNIEEIIKNEKEEQKNKLRKINIPYLNDFQKQLYILDQEKTTTCQIKNDISEKDKIDIEQIQSKWENDIQAKTKQINDPNLSKKYLVLKKERTITYTSNENNENNIYDKNVQKTNFNENESSSTDGDSEKESQLEDDGFEVRKKKKKYKQHFDIDIRKISENYENYILQKMKKYNHLNISELQKRILALKEENTTTIYIKSTEKNENNDNSNTNIEVKNENNKEDQIMDINKSTVNNKNLFYEVNNNSINSISLDNTNASLNDTNNTTISINEDYFNKSQLFFQDYISDSKNSETPEIERFNSVRAKYCLKYKLYDIPLNIQEKDVKTPEKCMIDEKYFGFLYPNNTETYYISESGYILNHNNDNIININDNTNYDKKLGLYFCGKNIEIKANDIKKCAPNNFICKECMKLNKKKYHIKDNYLININGRVVKKNKNRYHCFGHFLCNKQIEDCISKFSCEACKNLDQYSYYYTD